MVAKHQPAFAFYMLATRFWELAAGVLLFQALAWYRGPRQRNGLARAAPGRSRLASCRCRSSALVYGLVTRPARSRPVSGRRVAGGRTRWGCSGSCRHWQRCRPLRRLFENKAALCVGRISYSLYLWHWPVFVLLRWTVGLESASVRLVALALTFALATLSYRYVETPFRRAGFVRNAPQVGGGWRRRRGDRGRA